MRLERLVETWGTVIVIDATSSRLDKGSLEKAVNEVQEFLFWSEEKSKIDSL